MPQTWRRMDRMADTLVYEYKMLHGRAHKVEAQLNDLAAAGWQFVALASGAAA